MIDIRPANAVFSLVTRKIIARTPIPMIAIMSIGFNFAFSQVRKPSLNYPKSYCHKSQSGTCQRQTKSCTFCNSDIDRTPKKKWLINKSSNKCGSSNSVSDNTSYLTKCIDPWTYTIRSVFYVLNSIFQRHTLIIS